MTKKGYYLRMWKNIGLMIVVIGVVVAVLIESADMGLIIMVLGIIIHIVPHMIGELAYVCPKCKAKFIKTNDKIVLKTSSGFCGRLLLTCPNCKKTAFMKRKLVTKEECLCEK